MRLRLRRLVLLGSALLAWANVQPAFGYFEYIEDFEDGIFQGGWSSFGPGFRVVDSTEWQPASGQKSMELIAELEGHFPFMAPPGIYSFSFDLAGVPYGPPHKDLGICIDGIAAVVGGIWGRCLGAVFDIAGHTAEDMGWVRLEFLIDAPYGINWISTRFYINNFTALFDPNYNCHFSGYFCPPGPVLDNIVFRQLVPEPPSVALLIAAVLAGVGFARRRKLH